MRYNNGLFGAQGNFYKGNLHCHSTVSDGDLTHEQLVQRYKEKGYAFLCFSEHEKYTDMTDLNTDNFITLPCVEWSSSKIDGGLWLKTHHVHGIKGSSQMLENADEKTFENGEILPRVIYEGEKTSKEMAEYLKKRGFICIYNHPLWSRTTPEDFGTLDGYTALEVYNYGCDLESHTGIADIYWDYLLSKGIKISAVATDDNHNKTIPDDSFGGWIVVCAPSLTHDNIINAIMSGNYYSSSGPEIYEYGIINGIVYIKCSPVHHINFIAGNFIGAGFSRWSAERHDTISEAEFKLTGHESYVRIECVDKYGRKAWSNPIYLT